MNVETLLKQLIAIESVSGNEGALGTFIISLLDSQFEVSIIEVASGRFNVCATTGIPRVYLNTHLDTVPLGANKLSEDSTTIYGRGACDAKGSLAAMICAACNLRTQGVTNFGLFFDVGEEDDFCGILRGLPEKDPPFVIIGEPTNLVPLVGQRGLLGFTLRVRGKSAHGARPEEGDSAIEKCAKIVLQLCALSFPSDGVLGDSSLNIGTIEGGTATNVVADCAEISGEIRTVCSNEMYKQLLQKNFQNCEIEWVNDFDPIVLKEPSWITTIEKITKCPAGVERAFTELYFWPRGIIYGPGSMSYAHTDNEMISKSELKRSVKMYEKLVRWIVRKGDINLDSS